MSEFKRKRKMEMFSFFVCFFFMLVLMVDYFPLGNHKSFPKKSVISASPTIGKRFSFDKKKNKQK
jgi:hypothetical protein